MTYLFSEEGRRAMRELANRHILYAFDFDGTLAPISSDRHSVKISRSVGEWLKELTLRVPCAVVSGRSLSDLTPRIVGMVPHVIGNHGIESSLTPQPTLLWAEGICQGWKRQLTADLADHVRTLGAEIEDKRYSLTLHLRRTNQPPEEVNVTLPLLLQQLSPGPRIVRGKDSVNLLPLSQAGKGPAVQALMTHLRQTGLLYIGDDETDESVFALAEGLAMGIRVGRYAESRAQFYLKHQGEIEEVLRFLVHRLDRTPELSDPEKRSTTAAKQADKER